MKQGFIELMIVIASFSAVAAIAIPNLLEPRNAQAAGIPVLKYYSEGSRDFRVVVLRPDGTTRDDIVTYQVFKDTVIVDAAITAEKVLP